MDTLYYTCTSHNEHQRKPPYKPRVGTAGFKWVFHLGAKCTLASLVKLGPQAVEKLAPSYIISVLHFHKFGQRVVFATVL